MHNEPAFPQTTLEPSGMTLLDYFAGQALVGMGNWTPGQSIGLDIAAKSKSAWAYQIATAMLAEKGQGLYLLHLPVSTLILRLLAFPLGEDYFLFYRPS